MKILFLILLFVLGACLGSFLCCQARRLRRREEKQQKLGSRSVCLHCGRQLSWYENIPLLSWVLLRGRCRTCHERIGLAEPLSELGLGLGFLLVGLNFDPLASSALAWCIFAVTLALILSLAFLAIYDGLYGELPNLCLTISIICAIILVILQQWSFFLSGQFRPESLLLILGSVAILGGTYLLLYIVSHGRWVGDGDWLLGVSLGLALGRPWLALITLFLANFLASIVMLPFALSAYHHAASAKNKRNGINKKPRQVRFSTIRISFGPFFVAAFVITLAFAEFFCQIEPSML